MYKRLLTISVLILMSVPALDCRAGRIDRDIDRALKVSAAQMKGLAGVYYDSDKFPRSWDPSKQKYKDFAYRDWTCGFYPGSLWIYYRMTGDEQAKALAQHFTDKVKGVPYMTHTHDLGFMVMCSYGQQYKAEGDEISKAAILQTAASLSTRFNPQIGLIRSWNFGKWNYPVIIDNMMNLELLFEASRLGGDPSYARIAVSHADKTMQNHFRADNSSWHVVSYNDDGSVECKNTHQGYSDDSRWSRGQAWGLYGYTVCYRYTKDPRYLEQAKKIAELIMTLPGMPSDLIPYWDYDAPGIPDEPRDASAAAITASALLELQGMVEKPLSRKYIKYAKKIISSLCSREYLAEEGTNGWFILKHSTGAASLGSEIDVALNYADYYFLEAVQRYRQL